MRFDRTLFALAACATFALPGAAQQVPDSVRVAELERQVEAITRELESLRLGRDVVEADTSMLGLGPAASKVYRVNQGVSLGGYGELLYENFSATRDDGAPASSRDRFDALRAILYVGYKFNDRILFNSEIEIEHGNEAFLEFAYVDYLLNDGLGVRGGLLLAPLGLINELHEPPTFLGTTRPETEQAIIPSTWRENGLGAFGSTEGFEFRAYLVNGLDAVAGGSSPAGGFSGSGLRGGRQKGAKAVAEDFAGVARLDYTGVLGLTVGASGWYGGSAQGRELDGMEVEAQTLVWDLHGEYRARGLDLRALVAGARLDDAAALNRLNGLTVASGVGEEMLGWYVQAGYDVLRGTGSTHQLVPYVRYEAVDTQREVPTGFAVNPATDLTVLSLGAAWRPLPQVIVKGDWQIHDNDADTGVDQLAVALGWLF
ncbi:MAG: hypothetical protein KY453_06085 [Gemmatimonadetes bacterium]|nr:hypothetical protein [Gemmatimonadota bacterium]